MTKVAIQGIETSFHDVAARKFFGAQVEAVPCWTFPELCEKLNDDEVEYAVMAIENSIAGSLLQNYGLLQDYNFKIVGEIYLRIEMNLMALKGSKIEDIHTVQSHPIAIRQCSQYLTKMQDVKLIEKEDTAACAEEIHQKKLVGVAAVANAAAAEKFDLEILASNIETNPKNFTRFVILNKKGKTEGEVNKATLFFNLPHAAGSLAKVLQLLANHQVNLTKIQSVPIVGLPYKYNFHVDIEWNEDSDYENGISELRKNCEELSILGEYKKGETF